MLKETYNAMELDIGESEEIEPGAGWNYYDCLQPYKHKTPSPKELKY